MIEPSKALDVKEVLDMKEGDGGRDRVSGMKPDTEGPRGSRHAGLEVGGRLTQPLAGERFSSDRRLGT